ncbi:MAG: MFS transporter [Gammaproteobacteria bacterium]
MSARPPLPLLLLTVASFGCLYVPQPLLPELAAVFGVHAAEASLLITATMLPLALAPLFYGYVLEGVPALRMVTVAGLLLAAAQLGMALSQDWGVLLALRIVAGLSLPALFTALVTQVSRTAARAQVRQAVAWYIAATIFGGFLGRALSGVLAEFLDWRAVFGFWAGAMLLALWRVARLGIPGESHFGRLRLQVFREVLGTPGFAAAYAAIFGIFFVFAGFLNVLPFRLQALSDRLGPGAIGLAYGGYLVGLAVTLGNARIRAWVGRESRLLAAGTALYALGLASFLVPAPAAIYLGMYSFCGGMFLLHGRLSGQVNQRAADHQGVVNGLYIASYYLGGAIGSWVAPAAYRLLGWQALLAVLGGVLALAAVGLARMSTALEAPPGAEDEA